MMGASAFNRARREAAAARAAAEELAMKEEKSKAKKAKKQAAPNGINEHGMEALPSGAQGEPDIPAEESKGE